MNNKVREPRSCVCRGRRGIRASAGRPGSFASEIACPNGPVDPVLWVVVGPACSDPDTSLFRAVRDPDIQALWDCSKCSRSLLQAC